MAYRPSGGYNITVFKFVLKNELQNKPRLLLEMFSIRKIINIIVNLMTPKKRKCYSPFFQYSRLFAIFFKYGFYIDQHKFCYKSIIDIIYFDHLSNIKSFLRGIVTQVVLN